MRFSQELADLRCAYAPSSEAKLGGGIRAISHRPYTAAFTELYVVLTVASDLKPASQRDHHLAHRCWKAAALSALP